MYANMGKNSFANNLMFFFVGKQNISQIKFYKSNYNFVYKRKHLKTSHQKTPDGTTHRKTDSLFAFFSSPRYKENVLRNYNVTEKLTLNKL